MPVPRRSHRSTEPHRRPRRGVLVGVAAAGLAASLLTVPAATASAAPKHHDGAVVADWNAVAASTIVGQGLPPNLGFLYLGFVQAAVYDAVVGITGDYEAYHFDARAPRSTSTQAAVASAAHRVLVTYFPTAQPTLDPILASSLAAVPDGPAKTRGVAFGQAAADNIVALRQNDGRGLPILFTQAPAPGVWRPTPPAMAPMVTPWLGFVTPLLLQSPTQFMPAPPPALTSAQYTADLAEVRAMGSATSADRTAEQTATAVFYSGNPIPQFSGALRAQVAARNLDVSAAARLFAVVTMSQADALISVWRAKYVYGTWRPMTAIQLADTDGNPDTAPDLTWTPLLTNPAYPEYPSGYAGATGAFTAALAGGLGTPQIDATLTSTAAPGVQRTYATGAGIDTDVVHARVWLGIHFHTADEVGIQLGHAVAAWALAHGFAPTPGSSG
jgi:hypothetical protein